MWERGTGVHGTAKQLWRVGMTVKVGFLDGFYVVDHLPNPDRFCPRIWVLVRRGIEYQFTPHLGLVKIGPYQSPVLAELGCGI